MAEKEKRYRHDENKESNLRARNQILMQSIEFLTSQKAKARGRALNNKAPGNVKEVLTESVHMNCY